jgi:hypothetical protein
MGIYVQESKGGGGGGGGGCLGTGLPWVKRFITQFEPSNEPFETGPGFLEKGHQGSPTFFCVFGTFSRPARLLLLSPFMLPLLLSLSSRLSYWLLSRHMMPNQMREVGALPTSVAATACVSSSAKFYSLCG